MKQPKLMILGASAAQLPIIFKAVALGYYVITVDNQPDNVGHQFSQQCVDCSTVDRDGVLKFAQTLAIDGIVTFASDVATVAVAYVAEQMGLPGCKTRNAQTMSNKANFRAFQQAHHLNRPNFFISERIAELATKHTTLIPPLIFKPVDTSGSRGITKVNDLNIENCAEAFAYAQSFSRSGMVSIEEFIEGVDVSGDGFLVNGELCAIVTEKFKRGFIPTGHSLPSKLTVADQLRVSAEVAKTCQELNYRDGPLDFDVKISDKRVIVIELSPRLGGNGIPELIRRGTGFDLIDMTIQYALGKPCLLPTALTVNNPCGSWVFGSEVAGKIEFIVSEALLRAKVPELFEYVMRHQIGDTVLDFEHSGNSLGYALFDCPPDDYQDIVERLRAAMQLRIAADF
ncbi:MAG: ATP-grasp domain-containing protein [Methylococcaceae bacterium]|nr:ATP-grasp domain-containing protein [Methylococcaceae bacterium]